LGNFWATFSMGSVMYIIGFDQKWIGLHFRRFFHKPIRSPRSRI
jgi:hypothetical protein